MDTELIKSTSQFPWSNLITALTGLISGLGGSILGGYFAKSQWRRHVEYEKNKEERKLIIDKGEETLRYLVKWSKELYFFNFSRLSFVSGSSSQEEMNETIKNNVATETHCELDVFISIYFPEFSQRLSEIHSIFNAKNQMFESFLSGRIQKDRAIHLMRDRAGEMEKRLDALIEDLSSSLRVKITSSSNN